MTAIVHTIPAPSAHSAPRTATDRRAAIAPLAIGWIRPRLASDAPVPTGSVRLLGLVVRDGTFLDPDSSALVSWIGDGSCPHQVMVAHADDLGRYDVIISVMWLDSGPEPTVVLVNP